MLKNTEGQSQMDNPRKLATQDKQGEEEQSKTHNTICVGHHFAQTNTTEANKTWTLLQTTGGKDEPNIVFMLKSQQTSQHGTRNAKTHL